MTRNPPDIQWLEAAKFLKTGNKTLWWVRPEHNFGPEIPGGKTFASMNWLQKAVFCTHLKERGEELLITDAWTFEEDDLKGLSKDRRPRTALIVTLPFLDIALLPKDWQGTVRILCDDFSVLGMHHTSVAAVCKGGGKARPCHWNQDPGTGAVFPVDDDSEWSDSDAQARSKKRGDANQEGEADQDDEGELTASCPRLCSHAAEEAELTEPEEDEGACIGGRRCFSTNSLQWSRRPPMMRKTTHRTTTLSRRCQER